jgi:hypothetical protein
MSDWPKPVENPVYYRKNSLAQWAGKATHKVEDDPYGEADELARIANDLQNGEHYESA